MPAFDPALAHDVLLPIAEAAYLPLLNPESLPANYSVVGPLKVNAIRAAAILSQSRISDSPRFAMLQQMRSSSDSFGWVLQNLQEKTLIVSFRGTAFLEDWLHNLDFLSSPYEFAAAYGRVHQGFQAVYQVVRESLFTQIRNADSTFTRLILTGHSLGAALCELAAPDLMHNLQVKVIPEVHNFAGPRAGHPDFAHSFDAEIKTCFRVVNEWDIVPHLPPPLAGFEHVGQAVRIDGGLTLDQRIAHSLNQSYAPGLVKLILQLDPKRRTAASMNFEDGVLIGREP